MSEARRQRLGVFGSSFNPPTLGHAILLGEAAWQLGLDRTILVPTGEAWHKETGTPPPAASRLALARAAFESWPGLEISPVEVEREGPSYTYETLEAIHSANPDSQIFFVAGADAALGIGEWRRPERVLELARFAVAPRPEFSRAEVVDAFDSIGAGDRVTFFEMPGVAVSSTMVRGRIRGGTPWRHLVPPGVAEMIDNEDLYGRKQ